ncbi:hypothetical protein [Candidatus Formimonas warabiya]|uniref:DUF2897 family protein n=1 Tax=Formimonas warabiya TaxID=1761012 RepID=A0A3G1KXM8_FORW1|nr:hypothetical protein [Candidatus Formimonas warabiya]ATW27234.1 hypothetical protein DCMF_22975 [Candidatus Formimonas warabiya]
MSLWFIVAFVLLFLISSSFILFFNGATLRKPLIKMAAHNEDKEESSKDITKEDQGDQGHA